MAIYTIVTNCYWVTVHRSVKDVFSRVRGDYYLDSACEIPLTKATLTRELQKLGLAWIYEDGSNDWRVKVERHDA